MLNKVITAIEKYEMLNGAHKVTVALSGGADSVCLLSILNELKEKYGYTLLAVHINHQLRGEESYRDEEFAGLLCEKLSVPLTVKRIDVKSLAENNKESVELIARNVRYEIFKEVGDGGVVATAHSADDNFETVIYNAVRGSGLKGICGIPPKRDIYIRPLILCSRKEIEDYLAEKGLTFVTDSSNLTDDYTRNNIRHNVVPVLKRINPKAEQTVATMCANLREDEEFLSSTSKKIYLLCLRENHLDAELLRLQPAAIIKRVISIYLFEHCGINTDALHLENCKNILMSCGKTGLSNGVSVVCNQIRFEAVKDDAVKEEKQYKTQLIKKKIENFEKVNKLFLKNIIDCAKINGDVQIRTRLPADEIRLKGRNCTKTLKKLFNEMKLPKYLRDTVPIISDEDGVIWIYGVGVSERVAVDENTTEVLEVVVNKS